MALGYNLRREDQLDVDRCERLTGSIMRHLGDESPTTDDEVAWGWGMDFLSPPPLGLHGCSAGRGDTWGSAKALKATVGAGRGTCAEPGG